MIRVRTRFCDVPDELYVWLDQYVHEYWTSHPAMHVYEGRMINGRNFYFEESCAEQAMLFKLTWG